MTLFPIKSNILRPALGDFRIRTRVVNIQGQTDSNESELVSSILEPDIDESTREAERLIQLVVDHLKCYESHYRYEYLRNLFDSTEGIVFRSVLKEALLLTASEEDVDTLLNSINWSGAYLDRDIYVVPFIDGYLGEDSLADMFTLLRDILNFDKDDSFSDPSGVIDRDFDGIGDGGEVQIPNGTHIEPYPGRCQLPNVPELPIDHL